VDTGTKTLINYSIEIQNDHLIIIVQRQVSFNEIDMTKSAIDSNIVDEQSNDRISRIHLRLQQLENRYGYSCRPLEGDNGYTSFDSQNCVHDLATDDDHNHHGDNNNTKNIETRVRELEQQFIRNYHSPHHNNMKTAATVPPATSVNNHQSVVVEHYTTMKEIHELLEDLSPGTALTYQKQIVAPLVYRRQEILASSDTYRQDMHRMAQILNLLTIEQNPEKDHTRSNKVSISEAQVVHAPIIVETTKGLSPEEETKLQTISNAVLDIQRRIQIASTKFDHIADHYSNLILATSEKIVLIEEEIQLREQSKESPAI
jgi:hypothetical protein